MTRREVEDIQDWMSDDWEAKDHDRDLLTLVHRLCLTITKGWEDDPPRRRK